MKAPPKALSLSYVAIRFLIVLNLIYAAFIAGMAVVSLIPGTILWEALGMLPFPGEHRTRIVFGLCAVMVIGIAGAFVVDRVLRQLLAIVDTVRASDPFVAANARRLEVIAWWMLAGEGLRLLVGAIAWTAIRGVQALHLHLGFSWTPWLAVLLLFVLARVFAEGTRMRGDLEGTV